MSSVPPLAGSRVWVTGASAGLGESLARYASDRGAHVVLSARRTESLEAVAKTLAPDTWTIVPFDLTAPASFPAAVEAAGPVDHLVNNGGISQRSLALDTGPEVTRRVMETNFFGHVELSRLVLPGMLARGRGHVAVVSSVVGHFGTPWRSSYAASKHALHGYFDSLRYELRDTPVGISIVCPGFIHTDISVNAVTGTGEALGTMDDGQANGMEPEEFARRAWRGLLRGKDEVYVGGQEIGGIYLKRYAPRVLDWMIRRRGVR